jgi:hypothetical protein
MQIILSKKMFSLPLQIDGKKAPSGLSFSGVLGIACPGWPIGSLMAGRPGAGCPFPKTYALYFGNIPLEALATSPLPFLK